MKAITPFIVICLFATRVFAGEPSGYDSFKTLKLKFDNGVAFVTIDHPPINLIDMGMVKELGMVTGMLAKDRRVKVIVFQNDNPDYFLAHFDVTTLDSIPKMTEKPTELGSWQKLVETLRLMPKVTIAKIRGRARGAGHEFALAMDMRFGAINSTIIGQPEIALGILPGGGGTVRLSRITTRGRALEVILSGNDFDAVTAEKYGILNRALPLDELDSTVDQLARQIASFSGEAIRLAKTAFNAVEETTYQEGLLQEGYIFNQAVKSETAVKIINRAMKNGFQTYEGELDLPRIYPRLSVPD